MVPSRCGIVALVHTYNVLQDDGFVIMYSTSLSATLLSIRTPFRQHSSEITWVEGFPFSFVVSDIANGRGLEDENRMCVRDPEFCEKGGVYSTRVC